MPNAVIPASHRDLPEICPIVTLATNGPDGYPQVSAMWFLVDADGAIAASLSTSRQKTRNLQRRPEVTLFLIDPANPYRTLELRCRATVSPDPD